uniref:Uncharacterized protein n=1 Tax=Oncorhynchus kisutch TaxID=8019 RepID=A0A8C7M2Q4_ONCKI
MSSVCSWPRATPPPPLLLPLSSPPPPPLLSISSPSLPLLSISPGLWSVVLVGDKVIDYYEFCLFLATCNPSPFIALSRRVNTQYLLGEAGVGDPEDRLLQQEEDKKVQLATLLEGETHTQTHIHTQLGNVLENTGLIDSLNQTKSSSALIEYSLRESRRLQASFDQLMFNMHFLHPFIPLFSTLLIDSDLWLSSRSSNYEQEVSPSIAKKITPFQQAIRPDRLRSAMAAFTSQALGEYLLNMW